MAENSEDDWSTDSTKAVSIQIIKPSSSPDVLAEFHPKLTYSIFGDEERIFGYQGLKVKLSFHAANMRPNIQISYTKKFKTVGETAPTDIKAILEDYLPPAAFEKPALYLKNIPGPEFKPPGDLFKTFEIENSTYEIWKGSLDDPAIQQTLKRIQILVPFYIEGGTILDLEESSWSLERWDVFFYYQKNSSDGNYSPYIFHGYSTVYRYAYFPLAGTGNLLKPITEPHIMVDWELPLPEIQHAQLPCRARISQFVFLPPFSQKGHGSRLYNTIFDYYFAQQQCREITVEDPNNDFDDLRDVNDLVRLNRLPEFKALRTDIKTYPLKTGESFYDIVKKDSLDNIRVKTKIASRQFSRLVEMHLLYQVPIGVRLSPSGSAVKPSTTDLAAHREAYSLWQVYTSIRLYKHNKDSLQELEREERTDKLNDALNAVEADYARLLARWEKREKGKLEEPTTGSKRSPPDLDDEEAVPSLAKRVKFT